MAMVWAGDDAARLYYQQYVIWPPMVVKTIRQTLFDEVPRFTAHVR